jgi:hypothetical protein
VAHSETLTRMLHAVDALDWPVVRASFADKIRIDYTELFGGQAEDITADELVARWQGIMPGFDATQHLTGPCLVTDEGDGTALLQTHVRGYHHIADADGGPVWGVHGHYVARLAGGVITELTLLVFYQEGNTALPALAAQRAASAPRAPRPLAPH